MKSSRGRRIASGILSLVMLAGTGRVLAQATSALPLPGNSLTRGVGGQAQVGSNPIRYRVNYRPTESDSWQLYAETRSLDKANTIAAEVKESGYRAQVVDDLTPSPQPFPDTSETSASSYYPTSNWAADYNHYVVPGRQYNYGWYGGWDPSYGYRSYPNYWWNGGSSWNSGSWRGHYWNSGWRRGEGWNHSHRYWNHSHADRGTHFAHHERHSQNAHHMDHTHHVSAGHHSPGHHAAARHSSNASMRTGEPAIAVLGLAPPGIGRPPITRPGTPREDMPAVEELADTVIRPAGMRPDIMAATLILDLKRDRNIPAGMASQPDSV